MSTEPGSKTVRINSIALILLTTLATLVALAPVAIVTERPVILIVLAVTLPIVLWLNGASFESACTEKPGVWDFALGTVGTLFYPAFIGLMWFGAYWAVFWLARLVEWIINSLGGSVHFHADLIAFWPTIVLGTALVWVGAALSHDTIFQQLYPNVVGVKSAFYDLIQFARRNLIINTFLTIGAIAILVVVTLLTGSAFTSWWFNLILLIILFLASAPVYDLGIEKPAPGLDEAVEAVSRLLTAGGYDVFASPRTGREDVDPLLADIQFFAQGQERAFVGVVQIAAQDAALFEWPYVRGLLSAAWAMEQYLAEDADEVTAPVALLVILVGQMASDALRKNAEGRKVLLSESLDMDTITQILEEKDEAVLATLYEQHFGFLQEAPLPLYSAAS